MKKLKRTKHRQQKPPQKKAKFLLLIFKSGKLLVQQHAELIVWLKKILPENITVIIIPDSTFDHAQVVDFSTGRATAIPENISEHINKYLYDTKIQ